MQLSWWSLNYRWRKCRTGEERGERDDGTDRKATCVRVYRKSWCAKRKSFRGGENLQALRTGRGEDFHKGL